MAVKTADGDREVIQAVRAQVRERLPEPQAAHCEEFVCQFYRWVPLDDLADRTEPNLYGAALAAWGLGQQRDAGAVKVQVYNPDQDRDGWTSPHTIVQIVCDDIPFLVDSVTMELSRHELGIELVIHPVMRMRRDEGGRLIDVVAAGEAEEGSIAESVMHVEVVAVHDPAELERLRENIARVLDEVRVVVEDWGLMRDRVSEARASLAAGGTQATGGDDPAAAAIQTAAEADAFLAWLEDGHFTFLGYREYDLVAKGGEHFLQVREGSGLGILRRTHGSGRTVLSPRALALAQATEPLVLTKTNSRSTIHRPSYMDYVGVKILDEQGQVIGERRFLGLYTTGAYRASTREIPLLRRKVATVTARAGFPADSHDAKALLDIIESYPRDSLFQMDADALFHVATGILGLGERQRVRLFVTHDPLERFVECLVCLPRDRFNTENRERVAVILLQAFGGEHVDWSVLLSESLVARVQFIVRCRHGVPDVDTKELERRVVEATRAWSDDLRAALVDAHGEEMGVALHRRYGGAFPAGYRADWEPRDAVADIDRIEGLDQHGGPVLILYRPPEAPEGQMRGKLFTKREISLSDILPTFEHMGTRVVDERPARISRAGGGTAWIYDIGLRCVVADVERVRDTFEETFLAVLAGELEDDALGALVVAAGLTGSQVALIRAIARYLRQAGIAFSDAYIQRALVTHPDVAGKLVELFTARLHPEARDDARAAALAGEIAELIDAVASLDEDRILRHFLTVVMATLRTNYFVRPDGVGPCLALKLDPAQIPILPRPRPRYEIFVYSPRVEGIHLRGGKVARGGVRWSDRLEDFRTEILGLMKAQMVKNALIVPVGSKGGFVLRRPPAGGDREALTAEAIGCYEIFLSGLLDLTDNIVDGQVVPPARVVRYDDDDPYLVVAADKGTASFSDIANGISARYGFWLGDAFASGGSHGYDHKQMGITARGAWESVRRHFRELGRDIGKSDFTVAGIGDMSGDVFGNGMLLSPHIKLVAAFNHLHVFLDPDPDPRTSFAERRRLFALPRSTWDDYDRAVISEGGGVYPRSAKRIALSVQAREALAIEAEALSPDELISAILRAPVDLLWNGGIGTYVKASTETHVEVGDKAGDAVRIDATELRCKVVGEGGNLGFTQRGRIEYATRGGLINTDAIDNVAGVNCSDHEVNIKILLDSVVAAGELTMAERNALLGEMTETVAERVIYASYMQTQAMSLALAQAAPMVDVHGRLIRRLEQVAGLDREIEYLPTEEVISQRKAAHIGLMAPEMAVLMAYCKIHLYTQLLDSDLPEDAYLAHDLERYFPPPLAERFRPHLHAHRLRREIIATAVANQLVDRAGTTFAFRLSDETGAPPARLARAFAAARETFDVRSLWRAVQALDNEVEARVQTDMLIEARRLVERSVRWLAMAHPATIDIRATIERFAPGARMLADALPEVLGGADREAYEARVHQLREAKVPRELARRVAAMPSLPPLFDIVEIAELTCRPADEVIGAYFHLGARLELDWLHERIIELPRANRWQTLARAALRDDVMSVHRAIAQQALESSAHAHDAAASADAWERSNAAAVERWLGVLADIKASHSYDMTTLPVALREVRNLIHGGERAAGAASARAAPAAKGGG